MHVRGRALRPARLLEDRVELVAQRDELAFVEGDVVFLCERASACLRANLRLDPRRGDVVAQQEQIGELDRLVDTHPGSRAEREGNSGHPRESYRTLAPQEAVPVARPIPVLGRRSPDCVRLFSVCSPLPTGVAACIAADGPMTTDLAVPPPRSADKRIRSAR